MKTKSFSLGSPFLEPGRAKEKEWEKILQPRVKKGQLLLLSKVGSNFLP
jgi:hypothetical protein